MNLALLEEKRRNLFFRFLFFLQRPRVKKFFSIFFFIVFLGSILPFHFASANIFGDLINWVKYIPVRMPVTFLAIPLFIFAFMTLPFIGFWGLMVHWVMSPDFTSFPYTRPGPAADGGNPVIKAGLEVTFPIANMFIILALVFIAIATILRIESYGLKKLLPMLIIVALLVNFAPVLCGVVVDFANVFMNFFAGHVGGLQGMSQIGKTLWGEGGFWGDIMAMWGLHSGTEMATYISPIAKTIAVIIYNIVASIVLQMFFVLLFLRYIMIWLLVIVSPLAIVSYVLPMTRKLFSWWWNQLIQWSFIGVIGAFFLYLSAQTLSLIGKANLTPPAADTAWLTEIMNGIMPAIFAIAILMVGFFATLKSGGMFAGAVTGAIGAMYGKATNKAGTWAFSKGKESVERRASTPGTATNQLASGLERMPGVRALVGGPGGLTGRKAKETAKMAKESKEELENLQADEIKDRLNYASGRRGGRGIPDLIGGMEVLAEKHPDEIGDEEIGHLARLERAGHRKTVDKVLKSRPDLLLGTRGEQLREQIAGGRNKKDFGIHQVIGRMEPSGIKELSGSSVEKIFNAAQTNPSLAGSLLSLDEDQITSFGIGKDKTAKTKAFHGFLGSLGKDSTQIENSIKERIGEEAGQATINTLRDKKAQRTLATGEIFKKSSHQS